MGHQSCRRSTLHRNSKGKAIWRATPGAVRVLLPAAILAATFLAYAGTLAFGFVFDDHILIVTQRLDSLLALFPPLLYLAHLEFSLPAPARQLLPAILSHLAAPERRALLDRPWGWHLSVGAGACRGDLPGLPLVPQTYRRQMGGGGRRLIFGLHPIHAEAVADITSIQEPLSTLFILAGHSELSPEPGVRA